MRVLVTGGAGYIGSQMVRQLLENRIEAVVLDSLEDGHQNAVPQGALLRVGSVGDEKLLTDVFSSNGPFDAVIHFAGYISVNESVREPIKYFRNNVAYTNMLLGVMKEYGVKCLVFSSSAAVYGTPERVPIPESDPCRPINPYGQSKLMVEEMLKWCEPAWGLRSVSLRYFNASGATLDGSFGEDHSHESHIIPLALRSALAGEVFNLYGDDYPTPDGTCIRDYIHVIDLCQAHLLALDALMQGHATVSLNVGTGQGFSNRQIVEVARQVSGIDFPVRVGPRRGGDPAELVADSMRLRSEFNWVPRYSDLRTIVASAWKWHKAHPEGYADSPERPHANRG